MTASDNSNPPRPVAKILSEAIDRCGKTQKQIAFEAGFNVSNIICMLKQGATPIPLARVGLLARSVGLDPAFLLRRVMDEYYPETWQVMEESLGNLILTAHERQCIAALREYCNGEDLPMVLLREDATMMRGFGMFLPVVFDRVKEE